MKKSICSIDPQKRAEIFDFSEKCVADHRNLAESCPPEHLKKTFRWNSKGKSQYISKEELINRYNEIITPEIPDAIENATFRDVDKMGCKGCMISSGRVWFHPDVWITAINAEV